MADGFPRKFSLAAMAGVSAREFVKREDAFQQLVGDGLHAMSGHSAKSYPTKGEDGSIDSFLGAGAALIAPFAGLSLPAVIECKDHDDTLSRVGENILGGWDKVRAKLASKAGEHWPDLFKPWREAKSYVYVVSAVIPTQDVRETLERRIQDFFSNLSAEQRPPIERIIVMDWNDARLWLDCFPDVRDSWLGTGMPSILSLEQYRAGLCGFRRFLCDDALPFRAPAANSTHHPETIFKSLSDSQAAQGILLVGAGGVGKTRTSYETALFAEKLGWRVLYVMPTDPPVTIEQLSLVVLSQRSCKTLVIFEYLDQMPHLDIGALRRNLIPQAREAKIHLVYLANSRPGFVWKPHAERDALFIRVELSLTSEESQALSEWAVKRTAPKACDVLSDEEVFRICGRRPIIALLVAQQLEKLAGAGKLDAETVQPIRDDDLLGPWLRRRLSEDELTAPVSTSRWVKVRPHPPVVAAAAVLAGAPDDWSGLIAAGNSTLSTLHSDFSSKEVIDSLLELGWLEWDGQWLVAVHDVVADEVVEQTLFEHLSVRDQEFDAMVSIGVNRARSFGRIAKALSRVHGATSDGRKGALTQAAEDWLNRYANEIGLMFAKEDPTHGSYALGAVFGGSILEGLAIHRWSALVAPWLDKYDTDFEARHLFYRGLRAVSGDSSADLKRAADAWLSRWRLEEAASFVLAPLLHVRELLPEMADKLNSWSVEWLANYGNAVESQFVLSALLSRKDVKEPEAGKAITHALAWLGNESYAKLAEARFVLEPLLSRKDVKEPEAGKAITHALAWLGNESYAKLAEAQFVLGPLLSRKDVKEPEAGKAITHALAWLAKFGTTVEASFVLAPCLCAESRHPEFRESTIRWCERHSDKSQASFVLATWLKQCGDTTRVSEFVARWLRVHSAKENPSFLLFAWMRAGGDRGVIAPYVRQFINSWRDNRVVFSGASLNWVGKSRRDFEV